MLFKSRSEEIKNDILNAIKFASWLYDSGITVEIITIDKSSLGITKEENWNEKERENGVFKKSPEGETK